MVLVFLLRSLQVCRAGVAWVSKVLVLSYLPLELILKILIGLKHFFALRLIVLNFHRVRLMAIILRCFLLLWCYFVLYSNLHILAPTRYLNRIRIAHNLDEALLRCLIVFAVVCEVVVHFELFVILCLVFDEFFDVLPLVAAIRTVLWGHELAVDQLAIGLLRLTTIIIAHFLFLI